MLLQMPCEWTFHQVFDFFFKAHKILNLNFDPLLENAMVFIQSYFYHVSDGVKKPTHAMKELIHHLNVDIEAVRAISLPNM